MKKRTTTTAAERDPIYGRAKELVKLGEDGTSNAEEITRVLIGEFGISLERASQAATRAARRKRHTAGTPPDTSLHLGDERRIWLQEHGGIQPIITRLIDDAMNS